jgi:hypothetical protein
MSHCSVCHNSFPCAGFTFSLEELNREIASSCPFLHPALGSEAFGAAMSLRYHREHLFKQKSAELERLTKKLSEMAPEHKSRPTTEKKIADLKVELGVEE